MMDITLAPGTLYIISGPMRYEYTHEIGDISSRRLSIMRRLAPDVKETQDPNKMFNFGSVEK